jgi:hypothetical protein
MADKPQLAATSGGKTSTETEDGWSLTVAPNAKIELIATAPVGTDAASLTLIRNDADTTDKFTADPAAPTKFTAEVEKAGTYAVRLGTETSVPVTILVDEPATPGDGDSVVELGIGELDKVFLLVSSIVTAVGIAALVALSARHIRSINNLTDAWTADTFPVRSAGQLQFIVGMAGVGLLLGGLWLAALETRGRLRAAPEQGVSGRGVGKEVGDAAVAVLKTMTRVRGTIVVMFVGMVLALAALWAATSMANTEDEPKTPPASSTTAPPSTTTPPPTATDPAAAPTATPT